MIPDGPYTAVVDEIETDTARLELEAPSGDLYDLYVDTDRLPAEGRHESAVLDVVLDEEQISAVEYDETETERRKESMRDRFERLSERPPDDGE